MWWGLMKALWLCGTFHTDACLLKKRKKKLIGCNQERNLRKKIKVKTLHDYGWMDHPSSNDPSIHPARILSMVIHQKTPSVHLLRHQSFNQCLIVWWRPCITKLAIVWLIDTSTTLMAPSTPWWFIGWLPKKKTSQKKRPRKKRWEAWTNTRECSHAPAGLQ